MDGAAGLSGKAEWRARMKKLRDAIAPEDREMLSRRLCGRVEEEVLAPMREKLGRPLGVCVYAAFRSEADPAGLAERCLERGDAIFAPRILPGGEGMELRKVEALTNWIPAKWGVPEPDPLLTKPFGPSDRIDAVLVPGLAFAEDGGRLGYGGGYYDRLYGSLQGGNEEGALWVGFAFSAQIVDTPLPAEPHDLKLGALATETKVIRFA